MSNEAKVKTTIYLTKKTKRALEHYAVDNDMDYSQAVEMAVLALVNKG